MNHHKIIYQLYKKIIFILNLFFRLKTSSKDDQMSRTDFGVNNVYETSFETSFETKFQEMISRTRNLKGESL